MENKEESNKRFKIFHRRAEAVAFDSFLHANLSLTMQATKGGPVEITKNFPEESSLRSFSSLIRPFYNNDDRISFNMICGIVTRPDNNFPNNICQLAKEARKCWNGLLQTGSGDGPPSGIAMVFNGENITTGKLIDLFFNGEIFHTDQEKLEKLDSMRLPVYDEQIQMALFDVLQRMGELILWFDKNVIQKVLQNEKKNEIIRF